jgi:hypothetical protein
VTQLQGMSLTAPRRARAVLPLVMLAFVFVACASSKSEVGLGGSSPCTAIISDAPPPGPGYPEHTNVIASVFWVGEGESTDNGFIQNRSSAWEEDWQGRFGGEDSPDARSGYCPTAFIPRENAFYVALPYNDLDALGKRRPEAASTVPWFAAAEAASTADGGTGRKPDGRLQSVLEHRWVEVSLQGRRCYGQWEDVGPFLEDDAAYVFGTAAPRNKVDLGAGIDLSPAMGICLRVDGDAIVSWRFVEQREVPQGPWSVVVTAPR